MQSKLSAFIAMIPGVILPYAGTTEPSAQGWLLCDGRLLLRADYAALFAAIGTSYNTGGETGLQFRIPDLRGRAIAGKDNMGGTAASRLNVNTTGNTTNLSTTVSNIPSTVGLSVGMAVFGAGIPAGATIVTITSATAITISSAATATATGVSLRFGVVDGATLGATGGVHTHALTAGQMPSHTHTINASINPNRTTSSGGSEGIMSQLSTTPTQSTGGDQAHPNVQPTLVLNYLIKT
jgi:microcystin-dependent protein